MTNTAKLKWLMGSYETVSTGTDVYSRKAVSEQIITFPQMPRKMYSLEGIKGIAEQWNAVSSGNLGRSKLALAITNGQSLPARGGWIFECIEDRITFNAEHGSIHSNRHMKHHGPIAFYGWRECSWKARAFYLQLMSHGVLDHHPLTVEQISDRTTSERLLLRKAVQKR